MKNWSMYLLFDEPKISSKPMIVLSYSLRSSIFTPISLVLILKLEHCSRGDLVNILISRKGIRERFSNIRYVLPEKLGPTKSVCCCYLVLLTH